LALGIPVSIFIGLSAIATALTTLAFLIDFLKSVSVLFKEKRIGLIVAAAAAVITVLFSPVVLKFLWPDAGGLSLGVLGMLLLFVLLFLRMPIGFAMTLVGFLGMWALTGSMMAPLRLLGISPYAETASFIMAVLPLFVLMGELAFFSGMSQDLFESAYKWFGRMPGGLAMASVAGSAGFAAVCGDSLATAVTMGSIALPEMKKRGYSPALATGGIAAGGTLGILIPPSLGFIFYAIVTEESVGQLFVAGFIPGLLLAVLFILYIYIVANLNPHKAPPGEAFSFKEKIVSLKGVIAMVGLFILILGGILGGVFSPTEGGAIGAACCFCYALARRRINKTILNKALEETVKITCKIMVVVIGVGILGSFLASSRLPYHLANLVTGLELNRYLVLMAIVLLYLFLGCLMNVIPIMLLTLPAIFPSVLALGFDPIWFGVISVILMEMGQITPPIGIIVFAVGSMEKELPLETIFRGVVPFVICMLLCVLILTFFPQIALWLPGLFFK
jgi:tripartite ATP-independent transporter DctM subunit